MAWVCENFGTEPNVQLAHSIETFAWDDDGNLLIETDYPMHEPVGTEADRYAHLLEGHSQRRRRRCRVPVQRVARCSQSGHRCTYVFTVTGGRRVSEGTVAWSVCSQANQ